MPSASTARRSESRSDLLGAQPRGQLLAPAYYEPADPARVPPRSLAIIALLIGLALVGAYLIWRSSAVDDPAIEETPIVETKAAPPAAAPRPGAPPAAAATGPVTLTATDDVWLRVYEQGGPKLYEGTMRRGERYQVPANASAPLILTGRPNAIQVSVGATAIPPLGQPEQTIADVSLRAGDLVARFQGAAAPAASPPAATQPPAGAPGN